MDGIGDRIRKRRIELSITQEELATRIGYKDRSSINKIEKDGRNLRQSKIKQIADALQTTPDYIMGWEPNIIDKYLSDPDLKRLVLFAGANIPTEDREKFVDALISTIQTLNNMKNK